jgi:parallel beta-helix repeat protein
MQCKNTNWWNVTNNRVWDNYGPGIFVGGQNCILYKNEVTGSKNCTPGGDGSRGDGIIVDRSDTTEGGRYNTLTANMVCDNEGYDIIVQPNRIMVTLEQVLENAHIAASQSMDTALQ